MKLIINKKFGGFGLSDMAYERLIELGIPVKPYIEQPRNPTTGLFDKVPENEGEIIFDRTLYEDEFNKPKYQELFGRYWETWIDRNNRNHPLVIQVVEELGEDANGNHAKLEIVEIPDGIEYEIDEYDGLETIHEVHRSWG